MSVRQMQAKPTSDVGLNPKSPPSKSVDDQQNPWDLNHKDKNKDKQIVPRNYPVTHVGTSHRENETSSVVSRKATEVTPITPAQPTSAPRKVPSKRKVNGVWDSPHATDLTVHLALSAEEDLDEILEEFARLQRLGHFISAKQLFAEHLREHMERPQVLIEYIEMLLEQGDYITLSEIDDGTIRHACDKLVNSEDRILLTIYWKLVKVISAHYKPDRPGVFSTKREVIDGAIDDFYAVITASERNITSTEIKMLALFYRLCDFIDDSAMPKRLQEKFPSKFHEELYSLLLREGRIWDFRDIAVANVSISFWSNTSLVEDWSKMTTDTSTTLALLDILVSHIVYELEFSAGSEDDIENMLRKTEPLALSIIENDPDKMRSRPFIRWMLAKAQFADVKGPHHARSYGEQLKAWPGLVFHSRRLQLPQYIPVHGENPGWKVDDAAPRFERPIRMAMNISRELGDYQTEVIALQRLIVLSANPNKEFEELCNLQRITQGDVCGYSKTLTSRYLISDTEDLKQDLKQKISGLFDITNFSDSISMLDSWILNMLQYSLEREGPAAERALEGAGEDYQDLPWAFRVEIDKKFQTTVGRTTNRQSSSRLESRFKRNRNPDTRETSEGVGSSEKGKQPAIGRKDVLNRQKDGESMEPAKQHPNPRVRISQSPEEDEWTDDSLEAEQILQGTKNYAREEKKVEVPTATSQKDWHLVKLPSQPRQGGPGLASDESSTPTSRAAPSIFDQSETSSGTASSSNDPIKPTNPINRSEHRPSVMPGENDEGVNLHTLSKSELIEYLRYKHPHPRVQRPAPKIARKSILINGRTPNTDGSTSRSEERPHRRGPVSFLEDEIDYPPVDISDDKKLKIGDGGYKEHELATVNETEDINLGSQDQNRPAGNEKSNQKGKETRTQNIIANIKQVGEVRTHENDENLQRPEVNPTSPAAPSESKTDPVVATVESTEDLGENVEEPIARTAEDVNEVD
ncbi:uncharacterized protein GGS22DRAFT_66167 [Annulohypoxylon maeteangense]|uniref:uncharacterized protein n=1 Tax=Annulohypoxylon maeteangense TaxID=1927788 RepID=UPI002007DF3F|nr:uncharacterized protein GGS22DRAFT_66167 [Annulohypoxylon maeteangense]KAI0889020.1 hypothetical protein GGS22DRAFT_66167 [Annulohypoxylon maeteangense]